MKTPRTAPRAAGTAPKGRDARLKAALKANIARRKAQAAARSDKGGRGDDGPGNGGEDAE